MKGYSAYVLTPAARASLLVRIAPCFPHVVAGHVTYAFPAACPPPVASQITVVGVAVANGVQCATVAVNGITARPHGGLLHVTISLMPGQSPKASNAITHLAAPIAPFPLSGWTAQLVPFN